MDKKLEKWLKWMATTHKEIRTLYIHQQVFKDLQEIIWNNEALHKPNFLYNYLNDSYVAYVVMGIRRLVSKSHNKNEISLYRLLSELAENPHIISRKHFTSLYDNTACKDFSNTDFDILCDNSGDDHISKNKIAKHLKKLDEIYNSISEIADRRIAHRDKRELNHLPTHDSINHHIDDIYNLYKKYHYIFYGKELLTVQFTSDWKEILEIPWIPK